MALLVQMPSKLYPTSTKSSKLSQIVPQILVQTQITSQNFLVLAQISLKTYVLVQTQTTIQSLTLVHTQSFQAVSLAIASPIRMASLPKLFAQDMLATHAT